MELGKFAPLGNRGFIKGRGSGFGNEPWASGALTEYMQNSNDKVLLLPQCETKEALENIEEIVQIEGVDGIFIGPMDLATSMGHFCDPGYPEVQEAIKDVEEAVIGSGKILASIAGTMEIAKAKYEKGYSLIMAFADGGTLGKVAMQNVAIFQEYFPER